MDSIASRSRSPFPLKKTMDRLLLAYPPDVLSRSVISSIHRRSALFAPLRLFAFGLTVFVVLGAWKTGKLRPVRGFVEQEERRKDLVWFETCCTPEYIKAHPWTPEELAGTTGYPPGSEPHGTQMDFRTRRQRQGG